MNTMEKVELNDETLENVVGGGTQQQYICICTTCGAYANYWGLYNAKKFYAKHTVDRGCPKNTVHINVKWRWVDSRQFDRG